jgi:hypothetical protein
LSETVPHAGIGWLKAMDDASAALAGELSEPENGHLAPEEVLERLDSLSAGDKRRLRLIELRRLSGTDFQGWSPVSGGGLPSAPG